MKNGIRSSDVGLTARLESATLILTLGGDVSMHNSPAVRRQVLGSINRDKPARLVLNLQRVSYMDSSGLAVLVEAVQTMRKTGGRVVLSNVQPRVRTVMEIAQLNSIFAIAADERAAMSM
jgi:anti-anti-sigma factor